MSIYKHELIKNVDEKDEVQYCIYCGSTLAENKNSKTCPNKCVKVIFMKATDFFAEWKKEKTQTVRGPQCNCKYPLIS